MEKVVKIKTKKNKKKVTPQNNKIDEVIINNIIINLIIEHETINKNNRTR